MICSLQFFKEFVIAIGLPNVLGPLEEGRPMPPVRLGREFGAGRLLMCTVGLMRSMCCWRCVGRE